MTNRVVLINPKTKQVEKIYENPQQTSKELNINNNQMYKCLNDKRNHIGYYVIKYEKNITDENLIKWCDAVCWALDGTRKCFHCKQWFSDENLFGGYCVQCDRERQLTYSSSLNGFFRNIASSMKVNAKKRADKDNIKGICEITHFDLLEIYNNQQGKCYYSGIKMETKRLSNWQCSPERIDQSKGYTKDNTKLICLEFNTGNIQWSLEKILKIIALQNIVVDMEKLSEKVSIAKKVENKKIFSPNKRLTIIKNNTIYYKCGICSFFLPKEEYYAIKNRKNPYYYCIKCDKNRIKEYNKSLRGFLFSRLILAKNHASEKSEKRNTECRIFELIFDDLCDKIMEQKGRCYYSKIPLVFEPCNDWKCSIERIDNAKGYTKENSILICNEFNTADLTQIAKNKISGSAQWSKEKFNYLLEHIIKQ